MNRGIDRASIFDEAATTIFLIELRDACATYAVEVHGYCILPNHYHLLLHTPQAGLSLVMQRLSSRFTQAVNRLRSVPIKDDAHLMRVSQYIHLNPVEARLVLAPEAWSWSSAPAYLGLVARPDWLHVDALLEMFGTANPEATYAQFLHDRKG